MAKKNRGTLRGWDSPPVSVTRGLLLTRDQNTNNNAWQIHRASIHHTHWPHITNNPARQQRRSSKHN
jgi:hypothetical protein